MSSTDMAIKADAYGSELELSGETLIITAKGHMGKMALGNVERIELPVSEIRDIDYATAGRMKNGHMTLSDSRGKVIIHFRHKQNDEMLAMYRAVEAARAGS